jgi:4Fe-4S single cluster domain
MPTIQRVRCPRLSLHQGETIIRTCGQMMPPGHVGATRGGMAGLAYSFNARGSVSLFTGAFIRRRVKMACPKHASHETEDAMREKKQKQQRTSSNNSLIKTGKKRDTELVEVESELNQVNDPLPVLRYVEYHLVEHCNLTCNRCSHFSPLAEPTVSNPNSFARDLRQLARHFSNINQIRLLGGEPLLHPTPEAFVDAARTAFPSTDLRIVTNGTRLKAMGNSFWDACRRAHVTLDLSLYPVMEKACTQLEDLCKRERVNLNVNRNYSFMAGGNPKGDSDPVRSMAYCRSWSYCPFLKDSRLYVCRLPATVHYFNKKFGRSIIADPGIDIFDPSLDGDEILRRLDTPVETCRFCSCQYKSHRWERIRAHQAEDYEVSTENG